MKNQKMEPIIRVFNKIRKLKSFQNCSLLTPTKRCFQINFETFCMFLVAYHSSFWNWIMRMQWSFLANILKYNFSAQRSTVFKKNLRVGRREIRHLTVGCIISYMLQKYMDACSRTWKLCFKEASWNQSAANSQF